MPFNVSLQQAQADYPQYTFIAALTPSEQKAAFHVTDKRGRHLCLKIIAPDYRVDRLQREILALQSMTHPNIAGFIEYTFFSKQGQQKHYLVEEFVEGEDLSHYLGSGQQWSMSCASKTFAQICDGLAALSDANIVHRDLKPANIRIRPNGSPVIIDFGLARHLELVSLTETAEGAAIGTPEYFAPEQFSGTKRDIDCRTDLFAVGILLYQALIGCHPFLQTGMSRQELCDMVCYSDEHIKAAEFRALPNSWKLIVGRLLEKQRGKRPHNAALVASILRRIGGT